MRRWFILLGMICPVILTAGVGVIEKEISFPESTLSLRKFEEFKAFGDTTDYVLPSFGIVSQGKVSLPGGLVLPTGLGLLKPGHPVVATVSITALIPSGAMATRVEVISCTEDTLKGRFNVPPPPSVGIQGDTTMGARTPPDTQVYNSLDPYPGELVGAIRSTNILGYAVARFHLYPLQYIPGEKKLILHTRIRLRVYYEEGTYPVREIWKWKKEDFEKYEKRQLINPEDVKRFAPPIKKQK